ncbi:L-piperidine-6-carboxylate dehydrogenase [Edaphobacter dinghuensis]|uniref:aldehyde dehydrogenase (NAD(+)) n=1 Tax=Edaphobacter dinghuensis TaxID=1560005 RepID=A0A917M6N0_9BACT|nr:aldehyde dehydrogenase family protein [Edaphobacter dinghuensis]GGG82321.1 aldehyde dehydrogenase [Edaphobacter dinghuensis]
MTTDSIVSMEQETHHLLTLLGVPASQYNSGNLAVHTPLTGEVIAHVPEANTAAATEAITAAHKAFLEWRTVPAPKRGELIRLLGEEFRAALPTLGNLVTIETGKLLSEGFGEVQEMIDICTFAAGLSRQFAGLTVPSERAQHRMMETWHPLGVVGIISAFNFPVAVWSWNAALALVCGDAVVWKPSEKTPLTALAVQALFERAAAKFGGVPHGLSTLLIGDAAVGQQIVDSPLIPLVSATGSTAMGRAVAPKLAERFARAILELGGNNAAIICPSADLDLALRAIAFSAMGTAGQRCTTLRRLIVHESIYPTLIARLKKVFASIVVGDPRKAGTLVGPLIDERSFHAMQAALDEARSSGATITGGERVNPLGDSLAFYVRPALVEISAQTEFVKRETFAPILYVMKYSRFVDALTLHNDVPQGLSSAIFTTNLREAEEFLSVTGSDCGIANVNIGTSGAEIGGAFGGEKETGGGRESGSDAWKQYMRRTTNTINYGHELPLAQGVSFDIE